MATAGDDSNLTVFFERLFSSLDSRFEPNEDRRWDCYETDFQKYVTLLKELGIQGVASFDREHVGIAKKDTAKWMSDIRSYDPLLKDIAYTSFHLQNYPHAHRVLHIIAELGAEDIDTVIMKAECEIVIGNNEPHFVISLLRGLEDFVERTLDHRGPLSPRHIHVWNSELKENGRHLARVLLYYVVCCDYTKRMNKNDGDTKMDYICYIMREIAHVFFDVTAPRIQRLVSPTMLGIFQAFRTKVSEMRCGRKKNKKYIEALSCNYEAWLCIKNRFDENALACAEEGIKLIKEAYKDEKFESATLYGDLLANKAISLKNLERKIEANATSARVMKVYKSATDLKDIVTKNQLREEFRKAGM